ncbi:putative 5-methyltetrahydropteroyltriglutamate--homocysteine S-methyltransferase [Helianthus annuus]|nr:putative 5-methyltetrahydropteroyltriglutamate--homocysteine S-methyltransferase [Helianthus annuus]
MNYDQIYHRHHLTPLPPPTHSLIISLYKYHSSPFSLIRVHHSYPLSLSFSEDPTPFHSELPFFSPSYRSMASHIVGYPRMGPKRELKFRS